MGDREAIQEFQRLFALPGMNHCTGCAGAYAFGYFSNLEAWVERGQAPDLMISAHVSGLAKYEGSLLLQPGGYATRKIRPRSSLTRPCNVASAGQAVASAASPAVHFRPAFCFLKIVESIRHSLSLFQVERSFLVVLHSESPPRFHKLVSLDQELLLPVL